MGSSSTIELGNDFLPKFDANGLIPAIATDVETNEILMVAYMNAEALKRTIETRKATYYSRSRQKFWVKGESSGHVQEVVDLLVDCDQDCLILKIRQTGAACHVGYRSCFYRRIQPGTTDKLEVIGGDKLFDPNQVYKSA